MKLTLPLYLQTVALISFYLILLVSGLFFYFNSTFGIGLESLVASPFGDRFDTITDAIASEFKANPQSNWNEILERFGKTYAAKFYVFDDFGRELAGHSIELPPAVKARFMLLPPFDHPPPFPPPFALSMTGPNGQPVVMPPGELPGKLPGEPPPGLPPGPPSEFAPGPAPFSPSFLRMHFPPGFGFHHVPPNPHNRQAVRTDPGLIWLADSIFAPDPRRDGRHIPARVIVTCPSLWQTKIFFDFPFVAAVLAGLLLFTFLFWLPFIYRITHALTQLTSVTERIALGNFDARAPIKSQDEIGRLAEAVNTMASKLKDFVSGQRQFLGVISHELRTPIARLQMALELLSDNAQDDQKALIKDVQEEVDDMIKLVDELLAFSKAGLQGKAVQLDWTDLEESIKQILLHENPTCLINNEIQKAVFVLADPVLLNRSLSNVIRNSIRYGGSEGVLSISAEQNGSDIVIQIADQGPGVPEEAIQHLGEPFYRPEYSRNRSSGGVGLGLAIVKDCIEACQGSMKISNQSTGGLLVELRLKGRK